MQPDQLTPDPGQPAPANTGSEPSPGAPEQKRRTARRHIALKAALGLLLVYAVVAVYHTALKPLPEGLSLAGESWPLPAASVQFLGDFTGMRDGQRVCRQVIFDRALQLIRNAQDFVLADLFLFNDYLGKDRNVHRTLCRELTEALLEKKQRRPGIHMLVITDPVNEAYGGPAPKHLRQLRAAGIPVVITDLRRLRDSNPVYSSFWRMSVQWFGNSPQGPLPHPFSAEAAGVSVRSWLALLNFKANHRKLIIADVEAPTGGREMAGLVMSANPHDGSSAHGNVGLLVGGGVWRDLLQGEQAIVSFSGGGQDLRALLPAYAKTGGQAATDPAASAGPGGTVKVRVLTESKVRQRVLDLLARSKKGDQIDIGMFYLSERHIINELAAAAGRGATIRLLLDPNRDAFGYQKNGIPNRPVAAELVKRGVGQITVRWYDTHGEQFHSKLLIFRQGATTTLLAGSANLTRRNIGDYNLETDLEVAGPSESAPLWAAQNYFDSLWQNRELECSVPYETLPAPSSMNSMMYRLQEWAGLATF